MKQSKRGFTIVELVIVIAVIAVLAAVLIPTFASLIKKANLSADMQAVREMNLALAADEELYGRAENIDTVMQILANAGYNADNWQTLTDGYQVYWYREANRLVLYSSKEADVVYPDEYKGYMTSLRDSKGIQIRHFELYNQTVKNALEADVAISSSSAGQSMASIESSASGSALTAIQAINSAVTSNATIQSTLGLNGTNVYVNGSREVVSETYATGNYASMQVMQVSSSKDPTLTSSGDVEANVYYVQVVTAPGATSTDITTAQKAAYNWMYTLFVQMNNDKVIDNAAIMFPAGTVLDASGVESKGSNKFGGYFGCTSSSAPVTIKNAKLTKATSYAETVSFDGSAGKYFVTGFIPVLYGDAVVENVTYEDCTIDQPGTDFDMTTSAKDHSRNSVGIIGGVIDDPSYTDDDQFRQASNVTIRNVTVASSVKITGGATAAGLVGYVGGSGDKRAVYNGTLTIENCNVSASVYGGYEYSDYGPCGGLIGFICRAQETNDQDGDGAKNEVYNVVIKDSSFNGTVRGYRYMGAGIGHILSGRVFFVGTNNFQGANLDTSIMTVKADATPDNKYSNPNTEKSTVGVIGKLNANSLSVIFSTGTLTLDADMAVIGADTFAAQRKLDGEGKISDIIFFTSAFDTMVTTTPSGDMNVGGNNNYFVPVED